MVSVQRHKPANLTTSQSQTFRGTHRLEIAINHSLNALQAIKIPHPYCHPGRLSHDRSPKPETG
jgi:hypothetical protein